MAWSGVCLRCVFGRSRSGRRGRFSAPTARKVEDPQQPAVIAPRPVIVSRNPPGVSGGRGESCDAGEPVRGPKNGKFALVAPKNSAARTGPKPGMLNSTWVCWCSVTLLLLKLLHLRSQPCVHSLNYRGGDKEWNESTGSVVERTIFLHATTESPTTHLAVCLSLCPTPS
jgi:hypothetical protein